MLVYFASSILASAVDALESARFGTAACLGGCFMPLLSAAPDAMLIVSTTTSQASVTFGLKILANSNMLLLTVPWAIALFYGRRPLTAVLKGGEATRSRNNREASGEPQHGGGGGSADGGTARTCSPTAVVIAE